MAQTAKAPRKKTPASKNGSTKSASSRAKSARATSNGTSTRKPAATKKKGTTSARSKPRSTAQAKSGSASFPQKVVRAAAKAKTPLIAGGTALAGAAAGAVVKDRLDAKRSKNPLKKLRGVSLPKPSPKLNLGDLDLDKVKSTADRVSAYGRQASDIAGAAQKARKKNKP